MMFSYVNCLSDPQIRTDNGFRFYDVSNYIMKSVVLKISNGDISGTTSCLIAYCQQWANHIAYRLVVRDILSVCP